jgi:hypothetical protein
MEDVSVSSVPEVTATASSKANACIHGFYDAKSLILPFTSSARDSPT